MQAPDRIGSYRIERLLGLGSFATVWLGVDPALDASVAIKVLAENWSHDLRVRERFLDEGRLLWRLDHERLVRVHGVGELPDGRPYLVMAWARGGSLRDRLASGPVPVPAALVMLHEIASAAAVLHANGIVHRDLTPGNVLFRTEGGDVLLADLGLAKAVAAASGLTARAGTPGFMAPEQDDPLAVVDARTDVFGLGRLGVALLGSAPDRAGVAALRPGVPSGVTRVLRMATAPLPGARYPDAAAFAAALRHAVAGPRDRVRRLAAVVVLCAAVLAAVAASGPPVTLAADRPAVAAPSAPSASSGSSASSVAASPPGSRLIAEPVAPRSPSASPRLPSPTPSYPSACLGAVRFRMAADSIFELSPTVCVSVGAVLEIGPSGPGTVDATPESMVVGTYEAAITSFRFIRAGNVTVTVDRPEGDDGTLLVIVR